MKTQKQIIDEVENKWFKECNRLSNEIERLQTLVQYKSIKHHPEYLKLKTSLQLTNEAYNDVCIERDKLKFALQKQREDELEFLKNVLGNYWTNGDDMIRDRIKKLKEQT